MQARLVQQRGQPSLHPNAHRASQMSCAGCLADPGLVASTSGASFASTAYSSRSMQSLRACGSLLRSARFLSQVPACAISSSSKGAASKKALTAAAALKQAVDSASDGAVDAGPKVRNVHMPNGGSFLRGLFAKHALHQHHVAAMCLFVGVCLVVNHPEALFRCIRSSTVRWACSGLNRGAVTAGPRAGERTEGDQRAVRQEQHHGAGSGTAAHCVSFRGRFPGSIATAFVPRGPILHRLSTPCADLISRDTNTHEICTWD